MVLPDQQRISFDQLVAQASKLDDDALVEAWRINAAQLARTRPQLPEFRLRDELRLRHLAFRAVAIRRFGVELHLERCSEVLRSRPVPAPQA